MWVVEHVGHDGKWHTNATDAWLSKELAHDSAVEAEMDGQAERRVTRYVPDSAIADAVAEERERWMDATFEHSCKGYAENCDCAGEIRAVAIRSES